MTLNSIRNRPGLLTGFLILYFSVGITLFLIEVTRPLFTILTPWSLLFTFSAVLIFQKEWSLKLGLAFILVFASTLVIEIIGVNTGVLFGSYTYGPAFGPRILHTPVLIGLNWLILVYCSAAISSKYLKNKASRVVAASLLMVGYDLILEYVAPLMDMWSWETPYPGIKNFLMWFLTAMLMHLLFQWFGLRISNKPARYLFYIQLGFFSIIAISSLL